MAESYQNAIILPVRGTEGGKPLFPNAKGGVFNSNKQPIKDGFLRREYRQNVSFIDGKWDRSTGQTLKHHPLILPGEIGETKEFLEGTHIFAGYLFPHYGHFLLESLANLWFFKKHPDVPIIWLGVHNQPDFNSVNKQFIELFDIKNPIHILTEQTEVEELLVPSPGYLIHTRYEPEQVEALKLVEAPEPTPGKKIWLSRSNVGRGCALNEPILERVLEQNGWIVYFPEKHSIREQLDMLKDAEVVAGLEGSAFHTFVLIPDFKGKLHIFGRRRNVEFDFIFIAETLGLDQEVHKVPSRLWTHGLRHWESNLLWMKIAPILEVFDIPRSLHPVKDPAGNIALVTSRIMDAMKLMSVVEFWAQKDTILANNTAMATGIAVSEKLDFDVFGLPDNAEHLDLTPDQFITCHILTKTPDIYCFRHHDNELDLVRAFNSSMMLSSTRSIWIIEYYADERPMVESNHVPPEARVASANALLLQYIDSCCPMMSIARLRGSNLAIAWRQPKQMHTPSLAALSDLSTDLASDSALERCPVLSLNDIAKQYRDYVTPPKTSS